MDAGIKAIRIDWNEGVWRLWDLATNCKLAECGHLVIDGRSEFVNADNGTRGFAVTCGTIDQSGDRIIVKGKTDG